MIRTDGVDKGLRDRKKQATRRDISAAALHLALTNGPANVTVDDIAQRAKVSARTVFNYFPTREAAILGIDPDHADRIAARLAARPFDETPLQALLAATIDVVDGPTAWHKRSQLVRSDATLNAAYVASFIALDDRVTEVMAARLGLDPVIDLYPRMVVTVGFTAMRVAVGHVVDGAAPELSEAQVVDEIRVALVEAIDELETGFAVPPPLTSRVDRR